MKREKINADDDFVLKNLRAQDAYFDSELEKDFEPPDLSKDPKFRIWLKARVVKHGLGRYHNKGKVSVAEKINIWG